MTKGSDLLVRALESEGVEYIFGIPGEENLDVLKSLRGSKIKLVVTRHEQAAGFMAATYGRLTGRAGVCLTTLGPGALNLTTSAAYAASRRDADGDDHRAEGDPHQPAGQIPDRRHRRHDAAADQDGDPDRLGPEHSDAGARCVSPGATRAPRSGASRTAGGRRGRRCGKPASSRRIRSSLRWLRAAAIDRAARMIRSAERPLVMLGAAASRPQLADRCRNSSAGSAFPSSTRRWARAPSTAAPNCTWAPRLYPSATGFTSNRSGRSHHLHRA